MVLCEQLLKGIVYPLAVKSTQILALAHQAKTKTNKQTALLSATVRSSSVPLLVRFHYLSR